MFPSQSDCKWSKVVWSGRFRVIQSCNFDLLTAWKSMRKNASVSTQQPWIQWIAFTRLHRRMCRMMCHASARWISRCPLAMCQRCGHLKLCGQKMWIRMCCDHFWRVQIRWNGLHLWRESVRSGHWKWSHQIGRNTRNHDGPFAAATRRRRSRPVTWRTMQIGTPPVRWWCRRQWGAPRRDVGRCAARWRRRRRWDWRCHWRSPPNAVTVLCICRCRTAPNVTLRCWSPRRLQIMRW